MARRCERVRTRMWQSSGLFDHFPQCAQCLTNPIEQARAIGLRELSTRVSQVALQVDQEFHCVLGVQRVLADEKRTHHSHKNLLTLSEIDRLLFGSRKARRKDQTSRKGQTAGHLHAGIGLFGPTEDEKVTNARGVRVSPEGVDGCRNNGQFFFNFLVIFDFDEQI